MDSFLGELQDTLLTALRVAAQSIAEKREAVASIEQRLLEREAELARGWEWLRQQEEEIAQREKDATVRLEKERSDIEAVFRGKEDELAQREQEVEAKWQKLEATKNTPLSDTVAVAVEESLAAAPGPQSEAEADAAFVVTGCHRNELNGRYIKVLDSPCFKNALTISRCWYVPERGAWFLGAPDEHDGKADYSSTQAPEDEGRLPPESGWLPVDGLRTPEQLPSIVHLGKRATQPDHREEAQPPEAPKQSGEAPKQSGEATQTWLILTNHYGAGDCAIVQHNAADGSFLSYTLGTSKEVDSGTWAIDGERYHETSERSDARVQGTLRRDGSGAVCIDAQSSEGGEYTYRPLSEHYVYGHRVESQQAAAPKQTTTRRRDPETNMLVTQAELLEHYKDKYSASENEAYWRHCCLPMEAENKDLRARATTPKKEEEEEEAPGREGRHGRCADRSSTSEPADRKVLRVALVAEGSRGDAQPLLLLGRRLQAMGHKVRAFIRADIYMFQLADNLDIEAKALFGGKFDLEDQSVPLERFQPDVLVWTGVGTEAERVVRHHETSCAVPAVYVSCGPEIGWNNESARRRQPARPSFFTTSPLLVPMFTGILPGINVAHAGRDDLNGIYVRDAEESPWFSHLSTTLAGVWFADDRPSGKKRWFVGYRPDGVGKATAAYFCDGKTAESAPPADATWQLAGSGLVGVAPAPTVEQVEVLPEELQRAVGCYQLGAWLPCQDVDPNAIAEAELPAAAAQELVAFLAAGPPPVAVGWGSMSGANAGDMSSSSMLKIALRALRFGKNRGVIVSGWARLDHAYAEVRSAASSRSKEGEEEDTIALFVAGVAEVFWRMIGGVFTEVAGQLAMASRSLQRTVNRQQSAQLVAFAEQHCCFVQSAPDHWLLPHCACRVHHGGAGTTQAALYASTPMVITPCVPADQPYWAKKVNELGVGVGFEKKHLWDVSPAELAGAIAQAKALAPEAEELGRSLREEGGVVRGAELLQEFLMQEVASGLWRQSFEAIHGSIGSQAPAIPAARVAPMPTQGQQAHEPAPLKQGRAAGGSSLECHSCLPLGRALQGYFSTAEVTSRKGR